MSKINNTTEKTVNEWGMRVAVFSFLTKKKQTKQKKKKEEVDQEWLKLSSTKLS